MAGLEGGIVGGNVGGRIDFNGAVELGDPYGADFPSENPHRGAALLALAVDRLLDLTLAVNCLTLYSCYSDPVISVEKGAAASCKGARQAISSM